MVISAPPRVSSVPIRLRLITETQSILRPLGLEDLAWALLVAMTATERHAAVVASIAPTDVRSGHTPRVSKWFKLVGVAAGEYRCLQRHFYMSLSVAI